MLIFNIVSQNSNKLIFKTDHIQPSTHITTQPVTLSYDEDATNYDVVITGGGVAGLALSIQLAKEGHTVLVLEKEQYPFHRVCGEYVSLESWDFLVGLGVDLGNMNLPIIDKLEISGVNGKILRQKLPLGGFGISRYLLDDTLAKIARSSGVVIKENSKVNEIIFNGNDFLNVTAGATFRAKLACGSFGKRSNLDTKWKRPFITEPKNKLNNYIGVKYHIRTDFPNDTIALHSFKKGYCGIVKVEEDKYNFCYLTTADNLRKSSSNILQMENTILGANPHLAKIIQNSEKCIQPPVIISQVSFDKKSQLHDHILLVGDAAGMITPLCGNGISMALHGSKLAAKQIHLFLRGTISRKEMEEGYSRQWQQEFGARLRMGRLMQRALNSTLLNHTLLNMGKLFPPLVKILIRQTHGKPF
jgi:flavin-dependent dehydrogenase